MDEAVLNRIETDLADDRSKIDQIIELLKTLKAQNETIIDRIPRTETKLKDAVSDAMAEANAPVTELLERVHKSRTKRRWLSWLFAKRGDK